jgi:predicted transposase YdaD
MTEKELLKLKRSEMLEIMLAQSREIDKLREELEEAKAKVEDRELRLKDCGNIAEASLRLTNIFTEAQKAVDLYVENIKRRAAADSGEADFNG